MDADQWCPPVAGSECCLRPGWSQAAPGNAGDRPTSQAALVGTVSSRPPPAPRQPPPPALLRSFSSGNGQGSQLPPGDRLFGNPPCQLSEGPGQASESWGDGPVVRQSCFMAEPSMLGPCLPTGSVRISKHWREQS